MGKLLSPREEELQQRLIPINITVCVISLIAALTLFLCPILSVDLGKIVHSEYTTNLIDKTIDDALGKDIQITDEANINVAPIANGVVKQIIGAVDGKISVSAVSSMKVLSAPKDKRGEMVLDLLLLGEDGIIHDLIDEVFDAVSNMLDSQEFKDLVHTAIIGSLSMLLTDGVGLDVPASRIDEFIDVLNFKDVGPDGDVTPVVDELIKQFGIEGEVSDSAKQVVVDQLQDLYDDAAKALNGEPVTAEAIICVAVSKNIDLGQFDIGSMFDDMVDEDTDSHNSARVMSARNDEQPEEKVIVTSYSDMLAQMGLDGEKMDEVKEKVKNMLNGFVNKYTKELSEPLGYYGYLFLVMLVFIVPWLILFIFSLCHVFAKNKRFMMWYVKLLCWIPSVIWLAIKLGPTVIKKFVPDIFEGEAGGLIKAAFGSLGSLTWISGLCYVLLWLISIFWAFPIKHKIRKERKMVKRGLAPGYNVNEVPDAPKSAPEKPAAAAPSEPVPAAETASTSTSENITIEER